MTNINELAKAIYDDLAPWEKAEGDLDEIIRTINEEPIEVIKYLVERFIEN